MPASHVYYFDIGRGRWAGDFAFRVTDWSRLRRASIGATNLFLVVGMHTILRIFGKAQLDSVVTGDPDQGPAGVPNNVVRITKLGIPLYLLDERYDLDPNGTDVSVVSDERSARFRSCSTCGSCARPASRQAARRRVPDPPPRRRLGRRLLGAARRRPHRRPAAVPLELRGGSDRPRYLRRGLLEPAGAAPDGRGGGSRDA